MSIQGVVKTMWGSGMPGAGKTIFASIVINEVEARAEASEYPICVCYIYFRYSDHTTATVDVLPSRKGPKNNNNNPKTHTHTHSLLGVP
ncbi:hypothetical protein BKA70DRAFT_1440750 [Coprinopsis sp. MPI-PUGE-AT-0042]|nr:hypothetical protein BKA70DRAFT_1440750 [Coprinopsis sp. MPI-PUGE-AT-0042]